eukprot:745794-Hanusia_phi.AAC.3
MVGWLAEESKCRQRRRGMRCCLRGVSRQQGNEQQAAVRGGGQLGEAVGQGKQGKAGFGDQNLEEIIRNSGVEQGGM